MNIKFLSRKFNIFSNHHEISRKNLWHWFALGGILSLASFLNLFQLDQEAYANTYYAATVKSMLTSWHNFFFVSFDAGGFVSADKPPLGLWIQAISASLFGFSGLSLLLPEAIAGICSVLILYHLVQRIFGPIAGLLAALFLTLTPIAIVTERNNTIDSLLVLALLCATWSLCLALETNKLRWLLVSVTLIGMGFNIKMLEAYLILPALLCTYALGTTHTKFTRLWHITVAIVVLIIISLAWAWAVDLTPANARPYVGSSGTNSEISLILGYNGLNRLSEISANIGILKFLHLSVDLQTPPGPMTLIGQPAPLRLLSSYLGTQIGWLLPLAILCLIIILFKTRYHLPLNVQSGNTILWCIWFGTTVIYFSFSSTFHPYYFIIIAPAMAAILGIGITSIWDLLTQQKWWKWPIMAGFLITACEQFILDASNFATSRYYTLILSSLTGSFCTVIALTIPDGTRPLGGKITRISMVLTLLLLLISPIAIDGVSVANGNGGVWLPIAGSSQLPGSNPSTTVEGSSIEGSSNGDLAYTFAGPNWNALDPALITYLLQNQDGYRYPIATDTSTYASIFMLDTNQPALALGGYQGWDRIITPTQLSNMVKNKIVRFFYITSQPLPINSHLASATNNDLIQWVHGHCTKTPVQLWEKNGTEPQKIIDAQALVPEKNLSLYNCTGQ